MEPGDTAACAAVEGRGCLADTEGGAVCEGQGGSTGDTAVLGVVEGSGCGCDGLVASPGWLALVLIGALACRR